MRKKRLLFVNGNLSIGGTERSLVNLLNAIDHANYDIDLLLLQSGRELISDLNPDINVISRDVSTAYGPIIKTLCKNLIKRKFFEVIFRIGLIMPYKVSSVLFGLLHSQFGIKRKYFAAIAYRPGLSETIVLNCVKAGKKITWWHHGDFSNGVNIPRLRHNWSIFDKVVTVSKGIEKLIHTVIPECVGRTQIIYNMINPVTLRHKVQHVNPYNSPTGDIKLVTVSRLSPEKNLTIIIEIAKGLLDHGVSIQWAIVGGGMMQEVLRELIVENGLEEYIFLCGETNDPYTWMYYADLLVHPSLIESFGLVLVESMSLGTPCISAKSLGALEVISIDNGILVEDNSAEYVRAIIHFKDNPSYRRKLMKNCKTSVTKYTPEMVMQDFYSMIQE